MTHGELKDPAAIGLPDPPAGCHWQVETSDNKAHGTSTIAVGLWGPDGAGTGGRITIGKQVTQEELKDIMARVGGRIKAEYEHGRALRDAAGLYGHLPHWMQQ